MTLNAPVEPTPASPENAAAAIDQLHKKYPRWQSTAEHAQMLTANPRTKAMGAILAQPEFATMSATYKVHSEAARERQTAHRIHARRASTFGLLAAVTAGLMLHLNVTPSASVLGASLACIYLVFILIALNSGAYVTFFKPYRSWVDERNQAERLRIDYFHKLLSAPPPASEAAEKSAFPSTALKLEYVCAFLMQDQRNWFDEKAKDAAKDVSRGLVLRIAAFGLVFLATLPLVIGILSEPNVAAWLPASLNSILSSLVSIGTASGLDGRILALAGVAGGAFQTWLTSMSAASLSDRNALVYGRMVKTLDELADKDLPTARTAANAGGGIDAIEEFWRKLSFSLMAEHEGWSDALHTAQLLTLDKLNPVPTARS